MGCDQSLQNLCNNPTLSTSKNQCKSKKPSLNIIDQFEFDNTNINSNGLSTNRELNTKRSNFSDVLLINANIEDKISSSMPYNHKFFLNLEKIKSTKKNNFESDRSNTSNNLLCNNSEINDGIDINPQRRLGKSFISLIKEFNFIQKLFLKCLSFEQEISEKENRNPYTDNKFYIHLNDYKNSEENESPHSPPHEKKFSVNSLVSESVSVSCKSFNTLNSNFSEGKFQIKSTILKENKERAKYKDFFSKMKNLVFIPIVSLTGEVSNTFLIKKEIEAPGSGSGKYSSNNYSKMKLESISITLPFIENVQTYFLNFLENFNSNLNNCKIINNEEKKLKFQTIDNESLQNNSFITSQQCLQPLNSFFFNLKLNQVKNLKLLINLENLLRENDQNISSLNFGIGLNKIHTEMHEEVVYLIKNLTFGENTCLKLEEIMTLFFTLSSSSSINPHIQIHENGYVVTFQPKNIFSEHKIRNQISCMVLMAKPETDLEEEMKYLDELLSKNYSKLKSLKLRVLINQRGKMDIISLSLKREVKVNSCQSLGKEKLSHYTEEISKMKYEVLNIKFGDFIPDQYYISYEYQL